MRFPSKAQNDEACLRVPVLGCRCSPQGLCPQHGAVASLLMGRDEVISELRETLENEIGQGLPPAQGWEPHLHNGKTRWTKEVPEKENHLLVVMEMLESPRWLWRERREGPLSVTKGGDEIKTAREAMRAAEEYLLGKTE